MQILTRQNIFQVPKTPESSRSNKFFQSTTASKRSSGKKGIQVTRNCSVNFDVLYNPYRLKELGSFEDRFQTGYKSLECKEFPVYNCNALKCIKLGQRKENCEIESAERSQSTVNVYQKNQELWSVNVEKPKMSSKGYVVNTVQDNSFLSPSQIRQDMFGNMEKISSLGEDSFISFPSQAKQSTIYFSIISNKAN